MLKVKLSEFNKLVNDVNSGRKISGESLATLKQIVGENQRITAEKEKAHSLAEQFFSLCALP